MWQIVKSEFRYNWILLLGISALVAIIRVYETSSGEPPAILIFLMLFFTLQISVGFKNKEKRDRLFSGLPISIHVVSIARLLIPCLFLAILYLVFHVTGILSGKGYDLFWIYPFLTSFIILMLVYCIYLINRDLFLPMLREWGITKEKMKLFLVLLLAGINILGIVAFLSAASGGRANRIIKAFIELMESTLPFTPDTLLWDALGLLFIVSILSMVSFRFSSSHFE